jgi:hypothetical protein
MNNDQNLNIDIEPEKQGTNEHIDCSKYGSYFKDYKIMSSLLLTFLVLYEVCLFFEKVISTS